MGVPVTSYSVGIGQEHVEFAGAHSSSTTTTTTTTTMAAAVACFYRWPAPVDAASAVKDTARSSRGSSSCGSQQRSAQSTQHYHGIDACMHVVHLAVAAFVQVVPCAGRIVEARSF
jgi:hypothetical protein